MNKFALKNLLIGLGLLALALPAFGQDRGRPSSDAGGGGRGVASGDAGGGTAGSRGVAEGPSYASSTSVSARPDTNHYVATPTGGGSYAAAVPNLQGTSFNSLNSYYEWQTFLWHLRMRYMLDTMYFSRFYRNSEPLLTPQLLKLALREPLTLSRQMVQAVDEFDTMLNERQAGKPVRKQDIAEKAQEIRELAKRIRRDQSLSFVSQRLGKDMTKGKAFDNPGLEAIAQLRQMVIDLHTQLKGLYSQSTTSSVSVDSLSQPSFESLAKGIEKLTKVVENSTRHL